MFKIKTWYRDQFWEWCQKHDILCEYMGTTPIENTDTWYIGNEKDRMWAMLKWG